MPAAWPHSGCSLTSQRYIHLSPELNVAQCVIGWFFNDVSCSLRSWAIQDGMGRFSQIRWMVLRGNGFGPGADRGSGIATLARLTEFVFAVVARAVTIVWPVPVAFDEDGQRLNPVVGVQDLTAITHLPQDGITRLLVTFVILSQIMTPLASVDRRRAAKPGAYPGRTGEDRPVCGWKQSGDLQPPAGPPRSHQH